MSRVEERLTTSIVVADGGLGSFLSAELPDLRCPEEANLRDPAAVLRAHLAFIGAGATLIQTNTYGANRVKLAANRLEDLFEQVNEAGVKIAREAREVSGRDVLIGGSIGPLGTSVEHLGGTAAAAAAQYGAQARLLAGRGVDLLVLETFTSLEELVAAFDAVRTECTLPVIAQVTVQDDGLTVTGAGGGDVVETLAGRGAAVVGVNCSLGPQSVLAGLERMARQGDVPLSAQPNVGLPSFVNGRIHYPPGTGEYFAEFAAQAVSLGARVVGGCCGTRPEHVAAIRQAVDGERRPAYSLRQPERAPGPPPTPEQPGSRLAARLAAGETVLSVELDPPKGGNAERLLSVAERLHDSGGVEFFDVNDNPLARARMSSLMSSVMIERRLNVETIPHLTPRDATIRGLESQLLGAHASGIRNVLAVTGDAPPPGDRGGSDAAYQVDAIGLVETVHALNCGVDSSGKAIDAPTSFFVGVALNPTADDPEVELERFERKVAAGARFAMTQVLFETAGLERFLRAFPGGVCPIPLLAGVWPVTSHALALRLHNEVPGISVPAHVLDRLREAGSAAPREGIAVARDVLAAAREWTAGAYIVPPFGQPEAVLELLD